MSLDELLERADAPADLVRWVRDERLDFSAAWKALGRGDHRVWVAACGGAPIDALVEAAAAAVLTAIDTFDDAVEALAAAVELAVAGAPPDELIEAAEECERLAEGGVGTYRGATAPGFAAVARAAALVARAAEGLAAGEAHREATRLERARATSAYLGAGPQILLPAPADASRLDVLSGANDPAQGTFSFCVAACAEALREASRAVAARGGQAKGAETEAQRALDAIVRETIEHGDADWALG